MNMAARFIPAVLTLVLGFSIHVDQARAQAMVSYGHGVAKAAGAGAAVGAGVGGALTGLGNPLSTAADRRGRATNRTATVRRESLPIRRGSVAWDVPQQGFGAPPPLPLVGGVQATGATDANWQPSLLEPSQNLAVVSVSWGGPGAEASGDSAEGAVTDEAAPNGQAESTPEAKQNLQTVLRASGQAGAAGRKAGQTSGAVAPAALPEGIVVGTPVEQLLEKLGRPYLSFRGVAGEGYTDQYVFRMPDGGHLVVYVLDGVVAHLAVA
jgi:hypothetical protein